MGEKHNIWCIGKDMEMNIVITWKSVDRHLGLGLGPIVNY